MGLVQLKGGQAQGPGRAMFQFQSNGRKKTMYQFIGHQAGRVLSSSGRVSLLVLFRPSTDWIGPTYFIQENLLCLVYQLKHKSHPKTPSQPAPRIMQNIWAPCGPVTLTHKINHPTEVFILLVFQVSVCQHS